MIIGICGLIGSGKGTVADILIESHNFKKLSFADALKDGVAAMFNWPRHLLEGDTEESRLWREQQDLFWTKEMKKPISPRLVLQLVGTEAMRVGFYDGVWVSIAKQKLLSDPKTNWVLPDTRFPNEIEMIKKIKGQIWRVKRGPDPEWYDEALAANDLSFLHCNEVHDYIIEHHKVHYSEWAWVGQKFNQVIENDSDIDSLKEKVKNLVSNHRA
jgi:hypothetical protein